jgi:hypothetical protein
MNNPSAARSSNSGLAYDQAPPFAAPLLLYLIAPVFLLAAAIAGILLPEWIADRWSASALILTHLIALGFLGLAMCASLLQMLPVVIGIPVPAVRIVAHSTLVGIGLGVTALSVGLWRSEAWWIDIAMLLLGGGLAAFIAGMAASLWRARHGIQLRMPLLLSGLSLLLTVLLGLALAGAFSGRWAPTADMAGLTHLHLSWGFLGWTLILVVGVSWQVVPMLQLTPAYPATPSRMIVHALMIALSLLTLASLWPTFTVLTLPAVVLIMIAALAYALLTLRLYRLRRRKIGDATLGFWRLAMYSLILSVVLMALRWILPEDLAAPLELLLGLTFLLGFAASVVTGMLYKIIPFLCWFHLQAQRMARKKAGELNSAVAPSMKIFMPDALAQRQLQSWIIALVLLLPAPLLPSVASIPGLAFLALSALQLWYNLGQAALRFHREGGKFA